MMIPINKILPVVQTIFLMSAQVAVGQTVKSNSGTTRRVAESSQRMNEKPLPKPASGASYIRKPTQVRVYELEVPRNFVVGAKAKMVEVRSVVQLDVPCSVVDVGLDYSDLPGLFLNDGTCQMLAPQLSSNTRMEVICPLPKAGEPWTLWLYAPKTGDHMKDDTYMKFKSAAYSNAETHVEIDKTMRPATVQHVDRVENIPRMFTDSYKTRKD